MILLEGPWSPREAQELGIDMKTKEYKIDVKTEEDNAFYA